MPKPVQRLTTAGRCPELTLAKKQKQTKNKKQSKNSALNYELYFVHNPLTS